MLKKPVIIPVLATLICLVPFAGKAFHVDDPLFIWSAKHIQTNPADFYGFKVNWYGEEMSMARVNKNPPGVSYYIALMALLFGWSEYALHMALVIPAVAFALGLYYLAKRFCSRPALAALMAVLTPAFLVSSTNVMSDTTMLAFWIWAVLLWVRGVKENELLSLFFASLMIAICALTKYFGIVLLPLLFIYALVQKRKLGIWALFLLVTVVILAGYQWATHVLYGRGLLLDAAAYITKHRWMGSSQFLSKGLIGLAFTGGCIVTTLFYSHLLWSRRVFVVALVLTILFVFALTYVEKIGLFFVKEGNSPKVDFLVQFALMVVAGLSTLALVGADFYRCRDADSLLLLLWVIGTFVFASFVNWTVNARSILPMVPAAGILLVRRIDHNSSAGKVRANIGPLAWPLLLAAIVAISVSSADYVWANTAREAAATVQKRFENQQNTISFQGHWGFQYYMEKNGHQPVDFLRFRPEPDDIIIMPSNNTNIRPLEREAVRQSVGFHIVPCRWLATMNMSVGAGFYADVWGPLPFAVGKVQAERYGVFIVR